MDVAIVMARWSASVLLWVQTPRSNPNAPMRRPPPNPNCSFLRASRIEDVATHRRAGAQAQCRIGDVADRQFGRGLDVVRQNGRADRVAIRVVLNALDLRIGPGQLRTNVEIGRAHV